MKYPKRTAINTLQQAMEHLLFLFCQRCNLLRFLCVEYLCIKKASRIKKSFFEIIETILINQRALLISATPLSLHVNIEQICALNMNSLNVDKGRKITTKDLQKKSRTSSGFLTFIQFTSCVQEVRDNIASYCLLIGTLTIN